MEALLRKNIILGVFITLGVLLLMGAIYFIGAQQNLFGATTRIHTVFKNVSGLQAGNNVQFSGINVGTVQNVTIVSDSTVKVDMVISKNASQFIKKDAEASISSAGLMGNMIVNISGGSSAESSSIEDGDEIESVEPIQVDAILNDLKATTESAKVISDNLAGITDRLREGKGIVGNLFVDTTMTHTLENILYTFQKASDNAVAVTADLRLISQKTTKGEGAIGQLFMNETLAQQVELAMDSLTRASENSAQMLQNLQEFSEKLNNPKSPLGILLSDTVLAKDIEQTIIEVKGATQTFDEAAQKINNHWFLNPVFGGKEKNGEKDKDKGKDKDKKADQ